MVLCVLDDLLFSINIRTAAKFAGADVYFERKAEQVVATVREKRPALIIFDLNSQKMQPFDALAALKADPELRGIQTVGYVSHVDTVTIERARAAGVDEVLARSAFVNKLPELLTRG